MYKGIVMEVRARDSIVLANSEFFRIKNKNEMTIGQEILYTDEDIISTSNTGNSITYLMRYVATAAAFVIMMLLGATYYSDNISVYTAVTMDINPSIQLELNKKDIVVSVAALNDDGEVLEASELVGLSFSEAVEVLLDAAIAEGYIVEGNETHVVFSTIEIKESDTNKSEAYTAIIDAVLSDEPDPILENVTVTVIEATEEQLAEAIEKGLPTPVVVFEDDLDLSEVTTVKELFEETAIEEVLNQGNGKGQVIKESKQKQNKKNADKPEDVDEQEDVDTTEDETGSTEEDAQVTETEDIDEQAPGNSEENRGDLQAIIDKLTYVVTTYGDDETYSDAIADVQAYLDQFESDDYDFMTFKSEGQTLLKTLRGLGIKTGDDEEDSEEPEPTENVDVSSEEEEIDEPDEVEDQTADKEEKLGEISAFASEFKAIAPEDMAKMSAEDAEHFDDWIGKAEAASPSDSLDVLKEIHKEGLELKRLLREFYDIKGKGNEEVEEESEPAENEEEDDTSTDANGQGSENANNGNGNSQSEEKSNNGKGNN